MTIKTAAELAIAATNVAKNHRTLYVMGCYGAPMNASNRDYYSGNHEYNRKPERTALIKAASSETFGFDCSGLVKSLLWGWSGDKNHKRGGSAYGSNGVPDKSANQLITLCEDVSTDFSRLEVGELLWMDGHVGIYIGSGQAVESTPAWKNGVQVTDVGNVKSGTGHRWTKHGRLPWVEYTGATEPTKPQEVTTPSTSEKEEGVEVRVTTLKKGAKGSQVKALQAILLGYGYDIGRTGIDGDFGPATESAVRKYQSRNDLTLDGIVGPATWRHLLGV
jgi:cell wall-associated NlpC family hydrolase